MIDAIQAIGQPPQLRRKPNYPRRRRVPSRNVLVLGPRISDLNQLLEMTRNFDLVELSRAVLVLLADKQLKAIDEKEPAFLLAIADCARLWMQVADKAADLAPKQAELLPPSPTLRAEPMPFDLGRFERRPDSTAEKPSA